MRSASPLFAVRKITGRRRQRGDLPDLPAQFETILARDHDVENEQCRALPFGIADHRVSGGEHFHRKAIRFQMMPHQAGNVRIVFDYKDAGFHGSVL